MGLLVAIFVLSFVCFFIHLYASKKRRTKFRVVELLLLYQLVFNVGLGSFLAFIGLAFLPELVANYIAWPTSPFEHELANVNLGYGVLGIMAIWWRKDFWFAIVIGVSIWLLGDAVGHLADMWINENYSQGNMGVPLYSDIFVPLILIILLILYRKWGKR